MKEEKVSYKAIIVLTLPAIVSMGLEPMAEMIDTVFLGHVNTIWVGSLAATNACLGSFAWLFNFLSFGVTAQIAQSLGAEKKDALGTHILTALLMALVIGGGSGSPFAFVWAATAGYGNGCQRRASSGIAGVLFH